MKRLIGLMVLLTALLARTAVSDIVTAGTLYVSVDASQIAGLNDGDPVFSWANAGNGGVAEFNPYGLVYPTYWTSVAGKPAVVFGGGADECMVAMSSPDPDITGNGSYSVEAWAFNTNLLDHEILVSWAHRGTTMRYAGLSFGSHATWGAMGHWDWPDMGFDTGNPSTDAWHHICATFDGSTERVYLDGRLSAIEGKHLNLWEGDYYYVLGAALNGNMNGMEAPFSGAMGAARLHGDVLSGRQVSTNYWNDNTSYGQTAAADDAYWTNPGAADWNDGPSWHDGVAPAGQTVIVGGGGTVAVTTPATARMLVVEDGGLRIDGGSVEASFHTVVGAGAGHSARLAVNAGSFVRSGANWTLIGETDSTGTLTVASGALVDLQVGAFGAGAMAGAGIVTNEGTLIKRAAGVFGLGRADGATGVYVQNGAQAVTAVSNGWMSIGENGTGRGTFVLNGGQLYHATSDFNIADIGASRGYYVQNGGTASVNCLLIGKNNGTGGTAGFFTLTGGLFVDRDGSGDSVVGGFGGNANTYGSIVIRGGAMEHYDNFQVGGGGLGVFEQRGGSFYHAAGYPVFGRFATGVGVGHLTGGTFTRAANELLIVGEAGTGVVTIAGTAAVVSVPPMSIGHTATGVGVLNLNGGSLTVPNIYPNNAAATSVFNFNGGVLRASSGSATFLTGMDVAAVHAGGAVIDTAGWNIMIPQVLSAPVGNGVTSIPVLDGGTGYNGSPIVRITGGGGMGATAFAEIDPESGSVTNIVVTNPGFGYTGAPIVELLGGDGIGAIADQATIAPNVGGGLVKLGAGSLSLMGNNSYSGATIVSGGVLRVNAYYSGGGAFTVLPGATLGGVGVLNGPVSVTDDGILAPGKSAGVLTIDSSLALSANAVLAFELGSSSDRVVVTGGVQLGGKLRIIDSGGFGIGVYTLIQYNGALSGTPPVVDQAPAGFSYTISTTTPGEVQLIVGSASLTPFQQWQMDYFGSTNDPNAAPDADPDGDRTNNDTEFGANTNPTNSLSALIITRAQQNGNNYTVIWTAAGIRTNRLQVTTNLASGVFTDVSARLIIATPGDTTMNYVDLGAATNKTPRFYRVRVEP